MMTEEYMEQDHTGKVGRLEAKVELIHYKLEQREAHDERQSRTLDKVQDTLQSLALVVKEQADQRKELEALKEGHEANKGWINRMAGFVAAMFVILSLLSYIGNEKVSQIDQHTSAIHGLQVSQGILKEKFRSHLIGEKAAASEEGVE